MKKLLALLLVLSLAPLGAQQLVSDLVVVKSLKVQGELTPTTISSTQNDYAPTGFSSATNLRLASDTTRSITGIAGGAIGRIIHLHNIGSFTITLVNASASSSSSNRFAFVTDYPIPAGASCSLEYDGTAARWKLTGFGFQLIPISTGVSGLGSGVATFLATPSGANLFAALTTSTGTGVPVFGTSPTITTQATIPKIVYTGSVVELSGSGTPEGAVTADVGSVYHRTDGGSGTSLYVKEIGSGNTGWATVSSGGGGTPGGSNTQLQYNNSSAFGGISGATSNGTAVTFTSGNMVATLPKLITGINDTNGNSLFTLTATASAVNDITYANAATGNNPTFTASGSDSNVGFRFVAKGTGTFTFSSTATSGYLHVNNTTGSPNAGISLDENGTSKWAIASFSGGAFTFFNNGLGAEALGISSSNISTFGNATDSTASSNGSVIFSGGVGVVKNLTTGGRIKTEDTTSSTTAATGSGIFGGGVGVAENINAGGNIATQTIGKTLFVKSGSNAKSGTFTLSSGAATVTNTSLTANSVVVCFLKTASGTITQQPYATAVTPGTSFVMAGTATDNSTYNYIILEVN